MNYLDIPIVLSFVQTHGQYLDMCTWHSVAQSNTRHRDKTVKHIQSQHHVASHGLSWVYVPTDSASSVSHTAHIEAPCPGHLKGHSTVYTEKSMRTHLNNTAVY